MSSQAQHNHDYGERLSREWRMSQDLHAMRAKCDEALASVQRAQAEADAWHAAYDAVVAKLDAQAAQREAAHVFIQNGIPADGIGLNGPGRAA